jgi:signal transduction histidine kinase
MSRSMSSGIRGNPHTDTRRLERENQSTTRSASGSADSRAVLADTKAPAIADARQRGDQVDRVWRAEEAARESLIDALTELSGRCRGLEARNRELAGEVDELRTERGRLRSQLATAISSQPVRAPLPNQARAFLAGEGERRRLERDLHDGVQNELVALIVKLTMAEQDPRTPPALAGTLSELVARAEAALGSVREIAHGIYPSPLAAFGVLAALRAQARRASLEVSLEGTAPRSSEEAEVAVYFSCLEAIQNVAKHAGRQARVSVRCQHDHGTLAVCIADDGDGFDPAHAREGGGLRNIRDRIHTLGGTVELTSRPGRGTVVTISLPWPARQPNTARGRSASSAIGRPSIILAAAAP